MKKESDTITQPIFIGKFDWHLCTKIESGHGNFLYTTPKIRILLHGFIYSKFVLKLGQW